LQGIEKTLRDTLGKLESPNEATRIKLYKATETILERSLAPYLETQPDMVAARRTQLVEIVTRIENEYQNPAPVPAPEPILDIPEDPQPSVMSNAEVDDVIHPSVADENSQVPDVSVDYPVIQPEETPQTNQAPSVDGPSVDAPSFDASVNTPSEPPQVAAPVAPISEPTQVPPSVDPVLAQIDQTASNAPQVQAPIDDTVDLTSAPEIKPSERNARNTNVAWPDAATHPEHPEKVDRTTIFGFDKGGAKTAADKTPKDGKSKAELRAEKRAKRKRENEEKRAKKKDNRRRGRSLLDTIAGSIVSVILIIFLIGGTWILVESEYFDLFLEWRNGGPIEPTAEEQVAQDDFIPKVLNETQEQEGDWIEVFGPQDADKARGRGEVLVEAIGDDNAGGVRITSVNPGEFGEALIPLNGRILAPAASRKFALALSVSVTEPTQVYVRCLLKSGIEIGRRRFQLGGGRTDVLIDLDMTNVGAFETQPYLAINSDITGGGKSVELYDVRFQVQN
jgi:hypothetical protein